MRKLSALGTVACLFAVTVWLLTGCATVYKEKTTNVSFNSEPSGARIYVDGKLRGITPIKMWLESKHVYEVKFRKKGFETKTYTITNHISPIWVIIDVIYGIVPVIVDAQTGAWKSLDEDNINVIMERRTKGKK